MEAWSLSTWSNAFTALGALVASSEKWGSDSTSLVAVRGFEVTVRVESLALHLAQSKRSINARLFPAPPYFLGL